MADEFARYDIPTLEWSTHDRGAGTVTWRDLVATPKAVVRGLSV